MLRRLAHIFLIACISIACADESLNVVIMSMPLGSHIALVLPVVPELLSRGHNVTFITCDEGAAHLGKLDSVILTGPCPTLLRRKSLMSEVVSSVCASTCLPHDSSSVGQTGLAKLEKVGEMISSVTDIARSMCDFLVPWFEVEQPNVDVILFDVDAYCALHISDKV